MENMKTSLSSATTMRFTNGSGGELAAGQLYQVQSLVGIVVNTVANAALSVLAFRIPGPGVEVPCPADATGVFAAGDPVYYDSSGDQVVNSTAKSGKLFCGYAVKASASGTATVEIDLDSTPAKGTVES